MRSARRRARGAAPGAAPPARQPRPRGSGSGTCSATRSRSGRAGWSTSRAWTRRAWRRSPARWWPGACILPHDYRPRGIDDSKQLDRGRAGAAGRGHPQERHRLGHRPGRGRARSTRLNIYHAGLLALTRAVRALGTAARARAGRRAQAPGPGHPAHAHHPRRRALPHHRRRQHPGQDHPRRPDARAGPRSPGVRLRAPQGIPHRGALRGAPAPGRLPDPPPLLRARCGRRWASSRRRSRCSRRVDAEDSGAPDEAPAAPAARRPGRGSLPI